jgi:hypothetical protein
MSLLAPRRVCLLAPRWMRPPGLAPDASPRAAGCVSWRHAACVLWPPLDASLASRRMRPLALYPAMSAVVLMLLDG